MTLSVWTGYPELVPYYTAVGDAYTKAHPNVKFTYLSSSLREAEQKLSAAVPTGTGPDIYDIGTNISVNFIEAGLLQPNPPAIDTYMKSGVWAKLVVDYFTDKGKTYGLPLMDGSRASLYYNKTMFKEAGIAAPPTTFAELTDAARKLTKIDATGKMTRSGISLRLSGQGGGITEKFRFVLEPAGGALIVQTPSGKWHSDFDNEAGRNALLFYVDAVQKYKIDDPKILHDADAFVAGSTAMLMREAWVIGEIQQKAPTLEYGVVPIPKWTANGPYKMLLQPWPIYVNSKGKNQETAWDFLKVLTSAENALKLTQMTGWVTERQDIDWAPVLAKTPQFGVFVAPPKDLVYYVDPILTAFDEIESKVADKLAAAYVNPALNGDAAKIADAVHQMATLTDGILKDADLYGTT
jgi:multiple sugar transport system substrate-binding protein